MNIKDLELFKDNIIKDEIQTLHLDDTRKPKVTLKHLNKLRKKRELQKLELLQGNKKIEIVYGKNKSSNSDSMF